MGEASSGQAISPAAPVQAALASFRATGPPPLSAPCLPLASDEGPCTSTRRLGIAAVVALLVVQVVVVAAVAGDTVAASGRCEPITYAFAGSPPRYVVTEFGAAAEEIRRRSGLRFAPEPLDRARLLVSWTDQKTVAEHAASAVGGGLPADPSYRWLGYGAGAWRHASGRSVFVAGIVELDRARRWTLGADRGTALRAVIEHELGHVLGLHHTEGPSSLMASHAVDGPVHWTATDLDALADIGARAGCGAR